jgi:hypothetical protein
MIAIAIVLHPTAYCRHAIHSQDLINNVVGDDGASFTVLDLRQLLKFHQGQAGNALQAGRTDLSLTKVHRSRLSRQKVIKGFKIHFNALRMTFKTFQLCREASSRRIT